MDSTTLESIANNAVMTFGKTSRHAVMITELPNADHIDLHSTQYDKLIKDLRSFLSEIESITFQGDETEDFAHVLRAIRDSDQFAMMHILSAMSKFRSINVIGNTLTRWVEITNSRRARTQNQART